MSDKMYELNGVGGKLTVFNDKVILETKGILGFMTQGLAGGKTIPMTNIRSVQFKAGGTFANGFIQFGIAGGIEKQGGLFSAAGDENSIIFKKDQNPLAEEIKNYIEEMILNRNSPVQNTVVQATSPADEILKFKELFDKGIITEQEFETKKQSILLGK